MANAARCLGLKKVTAQDGNYDVRVWTNLLDGRVWTNLLDGATLTTHEYRSETAGR
jgi:hypothetical protein